MHARPRQKWSAVESWQGLMIKYGIYADVFAEKMWVAFAIAKATHIFFSKNTYDLDIVLSRTVNILGPVVQANDVVDVS